LSDPVTLEVLCDLWFLKTCPIIHLAAHLPADFLASPRLAEAACLIADVQMPVMTGIELYRHLIDTLSTPYRHGPRDSDDSRDSVS
jgi:DNA-binding NarL/FixJ family response regulator